MPRPQRVRRLSSLQRRIVRAGLLTPTLCVSYGGDLVELDALPGYAALKMTCAEHAIDVYESPMSVTAMINVGTGAVALGFAAEEHAFS